MAAEQSALIRAIRDNPWSAVDPATPTPARSTRIYIPDFGSGTAATSFSIT